MNKHIEDRIEYLQDWIDDLKGFENTCNKLDEIDGLIPESMNVALYSITITVCVSIDNARGISAILAEFCKRFGTSTYQDVDAKKGRFDYQFGYFEGKPPRVDLSFCFTGSACKMVQVDTKTVEVPVMELQCGDADNVQAAEKES